MEGGGEGLRVPRVGAPSTSAPKGNGGCRLGGGEGGGGVRGAGWREHGLEGGAGGLGDRLRLCAGPTWLEQP